MVDESKEAYLYDFGEYEDTATSKLDQTEGNKQEPLPSTTGLPLLFPLIRSDSKHSLDIGISNNAYRKPIRKNVKLPVVFNLI